MFRQIVMHPDYDGSDGRVRSTIYATLITAAQDKGCSYISDRRVPKPGWYGPPNVDYSQVTELEFKTEHLGAAELIARNLSFLHREKDPDQSKELLVVANRMNATLTAEGYAFHSGRGWVK